MRRFALALAMLLAVLLTMGCAKTVRNDLVYQGTRASYEKILDNWTRQAKTYEGLDCVLQARVTLISASMEAALNSERARAHGPATGMSAPQRNVLGVEVRPEAHLALLALYTHSSAANDLNRQPSSFTVWLVNQDGAAVQADSIIPVKVRPEELRELFPFLEDKWNQPYLVLFPTKDEQGRAVWDADTTGLKCVISGPIGRAAMYWSFK